MAFNDRNDRRPRHGIDIDQWRQEVRQWAEKRAQLRGRLDDLKRVGFDRPGSPYRYYWNVLIAIDQLGNALLGGDPDETISSRLGKAKIREDLNLIGRVTDHILNVLDPGHSVDAIEIDEGEWLTSRPPDTTLDILYSSAPSIPVYFNDRLPADRIFFCNPAAVERIGLPEVDDLD